MTETREFTTTSFNLFLQEKQLMGSRCRKCETLQLPPRQICPGCHGTDIEWVSFKGNGKLAAFTCIAVGTSIMEKEGFSRDNPYCSGIVQLEEGPRISARILGVDPKRPTSIKIGSRVKVRFLQRGEGEDRKDYLAFEVTK